MRQPDRHDPVVAVARGIVDGSIHYRLGPFGFMAYPVLTAESGRHASGDYR